MDAAIGQIDCHFVAKLPFALITTSGLSFDHERLNGSAGIDLITRKRGYPMDCLASPVEHLVNLERQGLIEPNSLCLVHGHRNCPQNLRCPLYSARGICQSAAERALESQRPYYGIAHLKRGGFRPVALDFSQVAEDVAFFAAGVPVVWNGAIVRELPLLAAYCFDHSHVWHLQPDRDRAEAVAFERLARVFKTNLHAPVAAAGQALCAEATALHLFREDHYPLHHLVGCNPLTEHLFIVACTGSLERVGEVALRAGCSHGVIVENGGSVSIGIRRPGDVLRPLCQSFYYREPTICAAVYQLAPGPARRDGKQSVPFVAWSGLGL